MIEKEQWLVQVYDENGNACKMPRSFEGYEYEVRQYIRDRFGFVDYVENRTTVPYKVSEGFTEDNIPQHIDKDLIYDLIKELKVIDFSKKGNVIRFYLGNSSDYYGDDWDDRPYEHNAGKVYDEFIRDTYDIYVPFDFEVLEPCDGTINSSYCKDDMKENKVPCIVIYKPEKDEFPYSDFSYVVGNKKALKIYFNTTMEQLTNIDFECLPEDDME